MTARQIAEDFMATPSYNDDGSKCMQFAKNVSEDIENEFVRIVSEKWGKPYKGIHAKRWYRWYPNG